MSMCEMQYTLFILIKQKPSILIHIYTVLQANLW